MSANCSGFWQSHLTNFDEIFTVHLTQSQPHFLKFMLSKKATGIDEIFIVDLTLCTKCQIDGEDFFNFCGLLRKHKLYKFNTWKFQAQTWEENVVCVLTEIVSDIQNNFCTQHVLPMFCKKKRIWQRFTCNKVFLSSYLSRLEQYCHDLMQDGCHQDDLLRHIPMNLTISWHFRLLFRYRSVDLRMSFCCLKFSKNNNKKFDKFLP